MRSLEQVRRLRAGRGPPNTPDVCSKTPLPLGVTTVPEFLGSWVLCTVSAELDLLTIRAKSSTFANGNFSAFAFAMRYLHMCEGYTSTLTVSCQHTLCDVHALDPRCLILTPKTCVLRSASSWCQCLPLIPVKYLTSNHSPSCCSHSHRWHLHGLRESCHCCQICRPSRCLHPCHRGLHRSRH